MFDCVPVGCVLISFTVFVRIVDLLCVVVVMILCVHVFVNAVVLVVVIMWVRLVVRLSVLPRARLIGRSVCYHECPSMCV